MQSLKASCRPIGGLHKPTSFMPGFSHAVAQPTRAAWGRQTCAGAPGTSGRETMYANAAVASQAGTPPAGAGKPAKKKVKKLVDINGDVTKDLGNGMFQIKLENGVSVMAHLSGKIRQNRIKIVTGDKVTVELSPYDLTRGRITYRFKPGEIAAAAAAAAAAQNGNSQ